MLQNCKMNVNPQIKKVVFELLSFCNLNCCYCLYRNKRQSTITTLSINEIYKLIDKFNVDNVDRLVLTGDEPTLHPYFIDISKYAMLKIPRVSICTNGVIPNKALEKEIIDLNFSSYTVSIDSYIGEIHDKIRGCGGSFNQVLDFLKKLKIADRKISIHITIHIDNIDNIHKTIDLARNFSNEIIVSTIYYDKNNPMLSFDKNSYNTKLKEIFETYYNQKDVILVGFNKSCSMENCLDKKRVFMVNQQGKTVDCYWKNFAQT